MSFFAAAAAAAQAAPKVVNIFSGFGCSGCNKAESGVVEGTFPCGGTVTWRTYLSRVLGGCAGKCGGGLTGCVQLLIDAINGAGARIETWPESQTSELNRWSMSKAIDTIRQRGTVDTSVYTACKAVVDRWGPGSRGFPGVLRQSVSINTVISDEGSSIPSQAGSVVKEAFGEAREKGVSLFSIVIIAAVGFVAAKFL